MQLLDLKEKLKECSLRSTVIKDKLFVEIQKGELVPAGPSIFNNIERVNACAKLAHYYYQMYIDFELEMDKSNYQYQLNELRKLIML